MINTQTEGPAGAAILDLDDLIESAQLCAADAKELAAALARLVKMKLAAAPAERIVLAVADLSGFTVLLDCLHDRAEKAHEAAMSVALARLEGVR